MQKKLHTQVVTRLGLGPYLQPFRRNSLLKYALQLNIAQKFNKKPYFGSSRTLKVIDVDQSKQVIWEKLTRRATILAVPICRLSKNPFRRNSLLKFTPQPQIAKIHYNPYFRNSKAFKVIDVHTNKSLSLLLVMISSMYLPTCNRFHAKRANSGKIITFKW